MDKQEAYKRIKTDFHHAIHTYFNSADNQQGREDANTVFDIFMQHWRMIEVYDAMDELEAPEDSSVVLDLEQDGVGLAQTYGSVFDSGMLKSLDLESRQELIEACIYALNQRQIRFENEVRARWYEQRSSGFTGG